MNDRDFSRVERGGVTFYSCRPLEAIRGLRHGFSARPGDLNLAMHSGESRARPGENLRKFLDAIGLEGISVATLSQVHSSKVVAMDRPGLEQSGDLPEGDALVGRGEGFGVGVRVADCFPVLVADPGKGAFGAVHAGWRGVVERILGKAIARMREAWGCDPRRLLLAMGPGIRSCCFEVGGEVDARFREAFPGAALARQRTGRPGKFMLDLARALELQAFAAGVEPGNLFDLQACSCCRPEEFYSYRADGQRAGRMMAAIGRPRSEPTQPASRADDMPPAV